MNKSFSDYSKASELNKSMLENLVVYEDGLVKNVWVHERVSTYSSATFAIFNNLLGNKKYSKEILENMEKYIGFGKEGLMRNGPTDLECCSSGNAVYGILNYLVGNKRGAEETLSKIKKYLSVREEKLVKFSLGEDTLLSHSNALYGILNYLVGDKEKAKNIDLAIEAEIGLSTLNEFYFKGDVVHFNEEDKSFVTHSNASFAILDYLVGNEKRAGKIIEGIEKLSGFAKDTNLVLNSMNASHLDTSIHANSLYGTLLIAEELKKRAK